MPSKQALSIDAAFENLDNESPLSDLLSSVIEEETAMTETQEPSVPVEDMPSEQELAADAAAFEKLLDSKAPPSDPPVPVVKEATAIPLAPVETPDPNRGTIKKHRPNRKPKKEPKKKLKKKPKKKKKKKPSKKPKVPSEAFYKKIVRLGKRTTRPIYQKVARTGQRLSSVLRKVNNFSKKILSGGQQELLRQIAFWGAFLIFIAVVLWVIMQIAS